MSKKDEALKLALEALESCGEDEWCTEDDFGMGQTYEEEKVTQALTAIREALAEQPAQQQEPVAWMDGYRNIYSLEEKAAGCVEATIALVPMANQEKTSGSPINELQCVCGAVWLGEEMVHLPDKRPPASKPWVGLTSEDKVEILRANGEAAVLILTEAKLREKNA